MSVDLHRRVEELMDQAERLESTGDHDLARPLYLKAARLEAEVFRQIPTTRPKTRGIIAVSVVSLLRSAGAGAETSRRAHEYLAHEELPDFARTQLAQLLAEPIPDQQPANGEGQPAVKDVQATGR